MPQTLTARPEADAAPRPWPLGLVEQNDLQETLHHGSEDLRDKVILALHDSYHQHLRDAARTMATCSDVVRFYIDPDAGAVRPWLNRCKQRLCPLCGRKRSIHVGRQLHLLLAALRDPRHLVLTVRSSASPLGEQLRSLRRWLSKLRRSPGWRSRIRGGAYVIECTWNADTERWHPHLHIIYDGDFFPVKVLQNLWHDITNGSRIVWLKRIDDLNAAANELSKYVAKPAKLGILPDQQVREYATAVRGARLLQTFGECHGRKVTDEDPHQPLGDNTYHVSLNRLVWLAARGAASPQRLVILLAERFPTFAPYIYQAAPQLRPADTSADMHKRLAARLRSSAPPPGLPDGRSPPVRDAPGAVEADTAIVDARIFIAFTRYRQHDQAGDFEQYVNL